ncbi:hypothetical protein BEI59_19210 [Eisenbergiella tayi]|uniref:Uncharacterized protein n=1 Tax=Eisenbergiella tayi TaxID=1432052 RepID=A0A1E3UEL3_9FIRM|nr:hypothetical protein BEI60_14015 [Eisenbergiella tayi]ODR48877.1 hypothetical protein BEI59_19210 [Eisenbergiella tayi]ODR60911.1 hypothetical protein BEI64_09145 [Eisenbergiella tayi]
MARLPRKNPNGCELSEVHSRYRIAGEKELPKSGCVRAGHFYGLSFFGNYRKNSASFTIKILHYPKIQVFSCKACKKYGVFRRKIKW